MKLIIDKELKKKSRSLVILISKEKEKVTAVIGVEKNISDIFDANDLIKLIIPIFFFIFIYLVKIFFNFKYFFNSLIVFFFLAFGLI